MSYEIPQQLRYEEKIIFGLTARQLGYASISFIPALMLFVKSNLGIVIRIILSTSLICVGSLFMFFDFSGYIGNFLAWFRFRNVSISDKKMIDFLGLEKVSGGVLYVRKTKSAISKK